MDLGISLFAGEAEGRFEEVLVDAWHRRLKPLYNYMADLPSLDGVPMPILPATRVKRTGGKITTFDAGRGCPFLCSFCTIINVQGRKSRRRSVDDIEQIIRRNLAQGINRFFITDDNFARNTDWEIVFDRLIAMREGEKLNIKFVIQVDTMCHRLPHFIEKAGRAGVARVFIGLESINPDALLGARKKQNKVAEYRKMLLEWKKAGVTVFAGYIIGFPSDTPESVMRDIETIQRELPIDLLEPHCLTPLPGSEDHQKLHKAGAYLDPDLNKYDLEHVTAAHSTMTAEQWQKLYHDAWAAYYSPEHLETVMRRSVATNSNAGNMTFLLLWYYTCVALEKIDPLEGGYLRRKYRKDRRPTLPVESPFVFYPRYLADLVMKHITLAGLVWRYGKLRRQLKRDPAARNYTDLALTPVTDDDSEEFVTSGHGHRPALAALVILSEVAGGRCVTPHGLRNAGRLRPVALAGPHRGCTACAVEADCRPSRMVSDASKEGPRVYRGPSLISDATCFIVRRRRRCCPRAHCFPTGRCCPTGRLLPPHRVGAPQCVRIPTWRCRPREHCCPTVRCCRIAPDADGGRGRRSAGDEL